MLHLLRLLLQLEYPRTAAPVAAAEHNNHRHTAHMIVVSVLMTSASQYVKQYFKQYFKQYETVSDSDRANDCITRLLHVSTDMCTNICDYTEYGSSTPKKSCMRAVMG